MTEQEYGRFDLWKDSAIEGSRAAAVRLEELWNDLQQTHPFGAFWL